jgi:hypothetical protein
MIKPPGDLANGRNHDRINEVTVVRGNLNLFRRALGHQRPEIQAVSPRFWRPGT